ncbi:MAG: hypothetical protein IPP13_03480 [Kouleothrix sp.]|jgi:hypothetical protein|nr:hypothetical protein [Kouleothrix sp.]
MAGYETNLASEFYILSVLHRLGVDATLTLGNKKSVDILVVRHAGDAVTVDVKGVAGKYDWPADNIRMTPNHRHFIAFVSYEGSFQDPTLLPSVWLVPYEEVAQFTKQYQGRKNVSRAVLTKNGESYRNAWHLLIEDTSTS